MQLAFTVMIVLAVFELLLYMPWGWRASRMVSRLLVVLVPLAGIWLGVVSPSLMAGALLVLSLYRSVNLLRVAKGRIQADYLYNSARSASAWLIAGQVAIWLTSFAKSLSLHGWLYLLSGGQIIAAAVLLTSTLRQVRTTKPQQFKAHLTDAELPTLTVLIPARNETIDLDACLKSLVASNYPKLEIMVLDDSSQDKRTPEIIRAFAQAGVRFVPGSSPPSHWLAKNYAYQQLAATANGELLLFCGVDARFEPNSLRAMVQTLLLKHKTMVCVMPQNLLPDGAGLKSLLLQPVRYAWELCLPRRLLERPPVLSTCWLISAEALRSAGSFEAVSRKIIPESYLARQCAKAGDGYSFLRAGGDLQLTSQKSFAEQRSTAVRTRYPQLHKRPELVAAVSLAELSVLIWPLCALIAAYLIHAWALALLAVTGYLLIGSVYAIIVNLTYRKFLARGFWLLPWAAVYDLWILSYSMWQYEFGIVSWKGRNINGPIMRLRQPASSSV